jgi:hypothetical protein
MGYGGPDGIHLSRKASRSGGPPPASRRPPPRGGRGHRSHRDGSRRLHAPRVPARRSCWWPAACYSPARRRPVSRGSSPREPVSTQRGLALRAPNSTRKFLTPPSSSLDELLAAVDVEGRAGDRRVDHQVDGQCYAAMHDRTRTAGQPSRRSPGTPNCSPSRPASPASRTTRPPVVALASTPSSSSSTGARSSRSITPPT